MPLAYGSDNVIFLIITFIIIARYYPVLILSVPIVIVIMSELHNILLKRNVTEKKTSIR